MDSLELERQRLALYRACEDYIAEFHRRQNTCCTMEHPNPEIPKRIEKRIVRIATHITFISNLEEQCP